MSRPRRVRAAAAPFVLATLLLAAFAPTPVAAQIEVPYLSGRVVDEAGVLSPGTADGLTTALADLEAATGAQLVVLTLGTLGGVPIEQYSVEVAQTWGLGDAERDDGVLFLIVRDDRLMRIEVGYGLEAVIPDVLAGRILDQVVRPRFRQGEFDAGVASGVGAISALIRGSAPAEVLPAAPPRQRFGGCLTALFWLLVLVIFLSAMRRRGGMVFLPGGGGWSGGSGGGFGGSSSGGGGFSGGGGSFGGGGASSSW